MISGSKVFVSEWIKLAQQKAMKRLSDVVVSDTTVENTDGFYFSSSSADARYVLQQNSLLVLQPVQLIQCV